MARGSLIHADETAARVVGKSAVVWVIASMEEVVFLIGQNPVGVAKWKAALAEKWISDTSRVRAVLAVCGQQQILLEVPTISSGKDRARNSLFAHGMMEVWFRVLGGAPMLLLTQMPFEGMQSVWKECILPQIQSVSRDYFEKADNNTARKSPCLTVVFGKGGVNLRFFRKLQRDGLHVFSYRFSADGLWPGGKFIEQEVEVQPGRREFVQTAEHELSMADGLRLREMRCIRRNAPPLTIISSDRELDLCQVGARLAFEVFEFTVSRLLDHLDKSWAVVRSCNTQHDADGTTESKAGTRLDGFLSATALIVTRAEAMMEQILRGKLSRPMESHLALQAILCESVDLVPIPGANIMKVFVHTEGEVSEQAVAHLCAHCTATETRFPGTNMRLVYEPVPKNRGHSG